MVKNNPNVSRQKLGNVSLEELRKFGWWMAYEQGKHPVERNTVILGFRRLFPQFADEPTLNFHWDKKKQLSNIRVYKLVPRVKKRASMMEMLDGTGLSPDQRPSEIQTVPNAVLQDPDMLG